MGSLNSHLRTHGKRPYLCNQCPKTFSQDDLLNSHLRIYTSEKKTYPCNQCLNYFLDSGVLKIHLRKHLNDFSPVWLRLCTDKLSYLLNVF